MVARALLCLTLAGLAMPALPAGIAEGVSEGEQLMESIQRQVDRARNSPDYRGRDLRNRTEVQDIERWAWPPTRQKQIREFLDRARLSEPERARLALRDASSLMRQSVRTINDIGEYWVQAVRIPSRVHWRAFTTANRHPSELDPRILRQEQQLLESLSAGDFKRAATLSQTILADLRIATDEAAARIMERRRDAVLTFSPRTTGCRKISGPVNPQDSKAKMRTVGNVDDYFPQSSQDRGETGKVVVRARIEPSGCASAFALVVRSGYPELDAAALRTAEDSEYWAPVVNGKPQQGELTFSVRFDKRGRATRRMSQKNKTRFAFAPRVTALINKTRFAFAPRVTALINKTRFAFAPRVTALINKTRFAFAPRVLLDLC